MRKVIYYFLLDLITQLQCRKNKRLSHLLNQVNDAKKVETIWRNMSEEERGKFTMFANIFKGAVITENVLFFRKLAKKDPTKEKKWYHRMIRSLADHLAASLPENFLRKEIKILKATLAPPQ